ncbi:hypothetical protein N7G274_005015 [Stereocaulon virgatum]|uniref:Uncharacterized protein n=1 Tax=Stereocaulon virgatum TaxID=373712 RepID=A0ABR4AAQ5_9LECA
MALSTKPLNSHLTDSTLEPFLSPTFSPIDYLNTTLPKHQSATSLSNTASQTQTHISTLAAQTSRLSTTLTTLTDDILRTSSRLAYEVELLRGEALSLADSLSSPGELHEHILSFIPNGLDTTLSPTSTPTSPTSPSKRRQSSQPSSPTSTRPRAPSQPQLPPGKQEPPALPKLRILLHVRSQLQSVIRTFNLALAFPMPPSLLATTTSNIISVSSPNADPDAEAKGEATLSRLRQEVMDLLADTEGRGGGVERAMERIRELRDVCVIWKGTSEERARAKWVDGLEVIVEDEVRRREDGRRRVPIGGAVGGQGVRREASAVKGLADAGEVSRSSTPGFLRRLRDEIYAE